MRPFLFVGITAGIIGVGLGACGGSVDPSGTTTGAGGGASSSSSTTSSTGSTTSSSSSSSSSSGTGGGAAFHGDCHTDADCNGGKCAPITPGGYPICLSPIQEATSCQNMGPPNECCKSGDCPGTGQGCYPASALEFCGGALPNFNKCVADECSVDADCGTGSICAPTGAFGYPKRNCVKAYCLTDTDCSAKPGGFCAPIGFNMCCSLQLPTALGCAYSDGCAKDSDCPNGTCQLDMATGKGVCGPKSPGCPP